MAGVLGLSPCVGAECDCLQDIDHAIATGATYETHKVTMLHFSLYSSYCNEIICMYA